MDFEREKPKCKFSIVDRPTVRQQLEYYGLISGGIGKDMLIRYWMGAQSLILEKSWECESIPDYEFDIEEIDNPEVTRIIIWAGVEVRDFFNQLENVPKN